MEGSEKNEARAEVLDTLRGLPISKPLVNDVRFRRKLSNLGINTVADLLSLSEGQIDFLVTSRQIGFSDADVLDGLKKHFERNPAVFASKLLGSGEGRNSMALAEAPSGLRSASEAISSVRARPVARPSSTSSPYRSSALAFQDDYVPSLSDDEYAQRLLQFEKRARESLDRLAEKEDSYLIYETFEDFPVELEDYRSDFVKLFTRYEREPRTALRIIQRDLPRAFLVFVADLAQEVYDGRGMWNRLFPVVRIQDANVQGSFKALFMSILRNRRMPVYCPDESGTYYQNTALLHGGLSEELWTDLWQDSIRPTVNRFLKKPWEFQGYLSAYDLLAAIRENEGGRVASVTLSRMLKKTPDKMIVPLLESAIGVAQQVADKYSRGITMLSGNGLPDTALRALGSLLQQESNGRTHQNDSMPGQHRENNNEITYLYLPTGSLSLDLDSGRLLLFWKKRRIPSDYSGHRVDYFLGGELLHSESVRSSVGCCILDAVTIELGLRGHYDVVMKLMKPTEEGGFIEAASLSQSAGRLRPGCLEFMETGSGRFELRGPRDRVTKPKRMAFVMLPGYKLDPGPGMRLLEYRRFVFGQELAIVQLLEVRPGASGEILNTSSGELAAAWQESYSASIERRYRLGKNIIGGDLYGVAPRLGGGNTTLPVVTVEGVGEKCGPSDIEATLVCDGKSAFVPKRVAYRGESDELGHSVVVEFPLFEVRGLDRHFESCRFTVRSLSTDTALFVYRFGVVPIKELMLSRIYLQGESHSATYALRLSEDAVIEHDGACESMGKNSLYYLDTPTERISAELEISTPKDGKRTTASLNLLGIGIKLPNALMERSKAGAVDLSDVLDLGLWSGGVVMEVAGGRPGRGVLMALIQSDGTIAWPLVYLELERPGVRSVNVLQYPEGLVQFGRTARLLRLVFRFSFGFFYENWSINQDVCDATVATFMEGLGTGAINFQAYEDGIGVRFQYPVRSRLRAEVHAALCLSSEDKVLESCEVETGAQGLFLSTKVRRRALARREPPKLFLVPLTPFGDAMQEYATVLDIPPVSAIGDD